MPKFPKDIIVAVVNEGGNDAFLEIHNSLYDAVYDDGSPTKIAIYTLKEIKTLKLKVVETTNNKRKG